MKISSSQQIQSQLSPVKSNTKSNKSNGENSNGLKKNVLLDSLTKQRQGLVDSKNSLINRTLKTGGDPSSIKDQLNDIDKQIKEIDDQINKVQLEEQKKAVDAEKTKKKEGSKENSQGKDEKQIKADAATDALLHTSAGLKDAQDLSHLRKKIAGNARALKAEIEDDKRFRSADPKRKLEDLYNINQKLDDLTEKIGENLKTMNNEVKSNGERIANTEVHNTEQSEENHNKEGMTPEQQQIADNIQCYRDNLPENAKQDGEKVDITA